METGRGRKGWSWSTLWSGQYLAESLWVLLILLPIQLNLEPGQVCWYPLFPFPSLSSLLKCFLNPYDKLGTTLDSGEAGRAEADLSLSLVEPVGQRERQPSHQ